MKTLTRTRHHLPVTALLLALVALFAGCGSHGSGTPAGRPPSTTAPTAPEGIVGRWERVVTCRELTSELRQAGLGPTVRYAWTGQTSSTGQGSFAPGSPRPTSTHPCKGALPRTHSHFFSASGLFGSLDWLGGQVDDGSYRLTGDGRLQIGAVTFRYRIVGGNTLFLTPVLTRTMVRRALARPEEYSDAGWAVSVAYAGHPWKRVGCEDRC